MQKFSECNWATHCTWGLGVKSIYPVGSGCSTGCFFTARLASPCRKDRAIFMPGWNKYVLCGSGFPPSSLGVTQLYPDLQQGWRNDPNAAKAPVQGGGRREDIRVKPPPWLQRFCWLYQQQSILKILGSFISWARGGNAAMAVISSLQLYFTCFLVHTEQK